MTVTNLAQTPFDEVLNCFLTAFEDYFFKMPRDKRYHQKRWKAAMVDFSLSYGMFDGGKLVGLIIHGIDKREGALMAYNTATGVIPAYRGKGVVDAIYAYALADLRKHGVEKSLLEVLTKNKVAIGAYKRNGFEIRKNYRCFRGTIKEKPVEPYVTESVDLSSVDWDALPNQAYYSWDNTKEAILNRGDDFFRVLHNEQPESFFVINPDNFYLLQFDVLTDDRGAWGRLFAAIRDVSETVTIINVDDRLRKKMGYIPTTGLELLVDLYEMARDI